MRMTAKQGGSYERMVAVVYCLDTIDQTKLVNAELLAQGYGTILLTSYCAVSEFRNEEWAKNYGC